MVGWLVLVFGVAFSFASVGLWLFPMGLGSLSGPWYYVGMGAMHVAGFVVGSVKRPRPGATR